MILEWGSKADDAAEKLGTFQTHEDLLHPLSIVLWLVLQFHLVSLNREELETAV